MLANVASTKKKITEKIPVSKSGNPVKSFSRSDFNTLVNSIINDIDYSMETVKYMNGQLVDKHIPVTRDFREKIVMPVLINAGVSKKDAKDAIESYEYTEKQTSCLYDFIADSVYQYLDSGKKFVFPNRKDFVGSIYLRDIDESEFERDMRDIKDHSTIIGKRKEKIDKHKTLVKKSSCPKWNKHIIL